MRSSLLRRFVLTCLMLCCGLVALMLGNVTAHAATSTVTTLADHDGVTCDESDGTLREVLTYVPAGGSVTFAAGVAGTITLGSQLTISQNVSVMGGTVSLAQGLGTSSGLCSLDVSGSRNLGCTIAP